MKRLSIIVPCYNEEEAIPLFFDACAAETAKLPVEAEWWFVDDGSRDGSLSQMKALRERDARVHYVTFSRNFGKEAAMLAGLEAATGDLVAVMDVDLQDPPALLGEMLQGLESEGFDCVATRRVTRKGEPRLRSFFARAFYRLINRISKTEVVDGARDFRLMTRQMADAILSLREVSRFSKGIFSWVGFKTKWLEYENVQRVAGETKWSFWKLLIYSLDGIIGFSTAPLAIASVMGMVFCLLAFVLILYFFIKTLIWGDPVAGFPAMICIILLLGGIQLFCIGILGQYLSKTYLETKRRPIYIAREKE
jgi:glucosyltransferase